MIVDKNGTMVFAGPSGVRLFRAMALRQGLLFYARTGLKPNRAWTPTAMLKTATSMTGRRYARGAYLEATNDLAVLIAILRSGEQHDQD